MRFNNDILGGEELIRSAIKSQDFKDGSEGPVTGWRIARDGSATFNNLTIGSANWTIDENGDAVFHDISADSITLDGENLAEIIDVAGRGVLALYELDGDSATNTTTSGVNDVNFARINVDDIQQRLYRITFYNLRINKGSAAPTWTSVTGYYSFDSDPGTSTAERFLFWQDGQENTATSSDDQVQFSSFIQPSPSDVGKQLRMWFYFGANDAGVQIQSGAFKPQYVTIEDMGPVRESFVLDISGLTPPTQTYTKTYDCVWSASWDYDGGFKVTGNQYAYQGDYSGNNDRYGKLGFDYSKIQSDLSGATIEKVEVRLTNVHTYFNDGWTASQLHIGTHNNTSEPSGSSSTSGTYSINEFSWNKGQTKYVTLSDSIGEALRDNTAKGLTTGRINAGTQGEYGYMRGSDGSSSTIPRLRITYTK